MLYYLIISISILTYVASDLLFASQIRKFWSLKVNIFRSFILVFLMIPLLFFADFSKINLNILFISLLFWISWAIYFLASLEAYKYLPAWIVASIVSLESFVVMILWYLFYSETFSYLWYFWAFILIISTILLSLIKNDFSHLDKRWFLWIILSIVWLFGWAFWWFWFAYVARESDIYLAWFLSHFSIFCILFPVSFFIKWFYFSADFDKFDLIKKISFSTLVYWSATFSYFYATTFNVSLSILFLSIIPVFVAIISNFIFKEKLYISQWILIILAFIWLLLINF